MKKKSKIKNSEGQNRHDSKKDTTIGKTSLEIS